SEDSHVHTAVGSNQSPLLRTVGLFIITPSAMRFDVDHVGLRSSGLSHRAAHTPHRPSKKPKLCAQKSHREPPGSIQRQESNARTKPGGSTTATTSVQDAP